MRKFKKVVSLFLALLLIVSSFSVSVFASNEESPIVISVETDKERYGAISTATITVNIENVSDKTIKDVNVAPSFKGTTPIGNVAPYILGVELKANDKLSFSYQVTVKPEKLNFFMSFILKIKRFFYATPKNIDVSSIDAINSETVSLMFGGVKVEEEIFVWSEDASDVFIEANNKKEAIDNENKRHENVLAEIEDTYNSTIYLINVRKESLIKQTGVRYPLSASYYQEKIDELTDEINELQRIINALQYDTSSAGIRKRKEYIAEQEELLAQKEEYIKLQTTSVMFEQLESERQWAQTQRDSDIKKENELHKNNLANIELNY